MPQTRSYRYFVKPLTDNTNEMIAATLCAAGDPTIDSETQRIIVDGVEIYGVYLVEHPLITQLSHSEAHRNNVLVYVQEGEGKVRPYANYQYDAKKISRSKTYKKAVKDIAKLLS